LDGVGDAGIDGLALGEAGTDALPLLGVEPPAHAAPLIVQPLGCPVPETSKPKLMLAPAGTLAFQSAGVTV
jgi:hypothetical protein